MKTIQILLSISLLVFLSCNDDDVMMEGIPHSKPLLVITDTLTVITQAPILDGYQAWGFVSDDNGINVGFNSLNNNQETQIEYQLSEDYAGNLHFSFFQLSDGQHQSVRMLTYSDIDRADKKLYLKSDPEQVHLTYDHNIQLTLNGFDYEDIGQIIILPDQGVHNKAFFTLDKFMYRIEVDENDRRFFLGILGEDDIWRYDYFEPAIDELTFEIKPVDLLQESQGQFFTAESGAGWNVQLSGLAEANNPAQRKYILRAASQDSAYNALYGHQDITDFSIPAVLLEEYDKYYSAFSVGMPTANPEGGYLKIAYGAPQMSFTPIEVDYSLKYSENEFNVEAMADYSYTRVAWSTFNNQSLANTTLWYWDAYGPIAKNIIFPILPYDLNQMLHQKKFNIDDFNKYSFYIAKDSKFTNYESLLTEILFQEENSTELLYPFRSLDNSDAREIESSYTFQIF